MNKDEILKMARNEYSGEDERALSIRAKAGSYAAIVGAQACIFFLVTHRVKYGNYDPIPAAIYFWMFSTLLLYRGIKLKQTKTTVFGAVFAVTALVLTVVYLVPLINN